MTVIEIGAAIEFGKGLIEECKKNGETVPPYVYERLIELYEQMLEAEGR